MANVLVMVALSYSVHQSQVVANNRTIIHLMKLDGILWKKYFWFCFCIINNVKMAKRYECRTSSRQVGKKNKASFGNNKLISV